MDQNYYQTRGNAEKQATDRPLDRQTNKVKTGSTTKASFIYTFSHSEKKNLCQKYHKAK